MRIAQVAPLTECVPPATYGGTERVVADLCDDLVSYGHEVTLFAAGGSVSSANLSLGRSCSLREDNSVSKSYISAHVNMILEVWKRRHEFDVIHFHTDLMHFGIFHEDNRRTLTTIHTAYSSKDSLNLIAEAENFPIAALSESHRQMLTRVENTHVVYNGLRKSRYRLGHGKGGYIAFVGRLSADKAPDIAIQMAILAGKNIKIAARIDPFQIDYFNNKVRPLLEHPLVEYVGEIDDGQKTEFLGNAEALLFPIRWPEPFGLVIIEAMACGTPVIAYPIGACAELIDDGTNGALVRDLSAAANAINETDKFDRAKIRMSFESRFTSDRMSKRYESIYQELANT